MKRSRNESYYLTKIAKPHDDDDVISPTIYTAACEAKIAAEPSTRGID